MFACARAQCWHAGVLVRMTEAVTEVAEAASSARYAVEASGAGARPDVVGDAVHVQLTNIIAVG